MGLQKKGMFVLIALTALFALSSCIGLDSDVVVRENGSGTIRLEYRLSRMFEALGKLDGNEKQLPLPVGRTDFERTVNRIPGLSLGSYSTTQNEKDMVIKAELAFSNLDALMGFLDATGQSARLTADNASRTINLTLVSGIKNVDKDLENLVRTVFSGYTVDLRFTVPSAPALTNQHKVGQFAVSGNTARYTADVTNLVLSPEPVVIGLSWKE